MTFAEEIESIAQGTIIACVIGESAWGGLYGLADFVGDPEGGAPWPIGKVISWEEARPFLDHDYDRGYGAPDCPAIYAWTEAAVLFVSQYDGATSLNRVPRSPEDGLPIMPGGG